MSFYTNVSNLLRPLFATEAMQAVSDDEAIVTAMLRAETALTRAQARADLGAGNIIRFGKPAVHVMPQDGQSPRRGRALQRRILNCNAGA